MRLILEYNCKFVIIYLWSLIFWLQQGLVFEGVHNFACDILSCFLVDISDDNANSEHLCQELLTELNKVCMAHMLESIVSFYRREASVQHDSASKLSAN